MLDDDEGVPRLTKIWGNFGGDVTSACKHFCALGPIWVSGEVEFPKAG